MSRTLFPWEIETTTTTNEMDISQDMKPTDFDSIKKGACKGHEKGANYFIGKIRQFLQHNKKSEQLTALEHEQSHEQNHAIADRKIPVKSPEQHSHTEADVSMRGLEVAVGSEHSEAMVQNKPATQLAIRQLSKD
ncbi:hypothetical protein ACH3XW_32680 [Acanthocheilonema viteae]